MAARSSKRRPATADGGSALNLQQILEDLDGVERLIQMQIALLREMRRRLREVEGRTSADA